MGLGDYCYDIVGGTAQSLVENINIYKLHARKPQYL